MVSNIETGGPGAFGGCCNFWLMAVFFEEPGMNIIHIEFDIIFDKATAAVSQAGSKLVVLMSGIFAQGDSVS